MAFPNIFENITHDNIINVNNRNIKHTGHFSLIVKGKLCTFKV